MNYDSVMMAYVAQCIVIVGIGLAMMSLLVEYRKGLHDHRRREKIFLLVCAAEQLYGPGKGDAKRRFVREKTKQGGLGEVPREDVEYAVYRLNFEQPTIKRSA